MADVTSHTHRFVSRTSLKGVSRILHAECLPLRMLWSMTFLFFLGVSFFMTFNLVVQFMAGEKVIILAEDLAGDLKEYRFIRPQFSVCNLNPFSSHPAQNQSTPTPSEYKQYVINFTSCQNCSAEVTSQMEKLQHNLLSTSGYFKYIGPEGARALGHRKDTLIVDCSALYVEADVPRERRCEEVFDFRSQLSEDYFNCYTLEYRGDLDPELLVTGVSMVLYLDNVKPQTVWRPESLTKWPSEGAAIAPNPGSLLPNMATRGLLLMPGAHTQVTIEASERSRLNIPEGSCRQSLPEGLVQGTGLQDNEIYSNHICLSVCLSHQVVLRCGCHDVYLPFNVNVPNNATTNTNNNTNNANANTNVNNGGYCGTPRDGMNWEQLLGEIQCAQTARRNANPSCIDLCPLACKEKTYRTGTSMARWPQYRHERELFDALVARGLVGDNGGNLSDNEVQRFVDSNVLKVSMYIPDLKHAEVTDTIKTTVTDFISTLGGALNLWSGITVLVVVEMVDFVIYWVWKTAVSTANGKETS